MNSNLRNRPKDCEVPDCPFNPYVEKVCSNCGRTRPKSNFLVWASLAIGHFIIWVFIAIGLCIGVVVSILGTCFGALSNTPNTKPDPTPMGFLVFGVLLIAGMIALSVYVIMKMRKK